MDFYELWLRIDEANRFRFGQGRGPRRGHVPGAFGNDPSRARLRKLKVRGEEEVGRGEISGMDVQTRVDAGKSIESLILKALAEVSGWEIEQSSMQQDMHRKIDGWRVDGGQKTAIQAKFRDSGSDIAVKVEWRGKPGRDLRGDAELYAVLSQDGMTIRVRDANQVKATARRMLEQYNDASRPSMLRLDDGQIRSAFDPHDGSRIVMAYIYPDADSLTYREDFRLPKVIWRYRAA